MARQVRETGLADFEGTSLSTWVAPHVLGKVLPCSVRFRHGIRGILQPYFGYSVATRTTVRSGNIFAPLATPVPVPEDPCLQNLQLPGKRGHETLPKRSVSLM
jgi:hypothetical protein